MGIPKFECRKPMESRRAAEGAEGNDGKSATRLAHSTTWPKFGWATGTSK
jgi:hypothetical protein